VGGELLEADHVVWACGPWLGSLFPDLVQMRATLQEVVFFESPPEWRSVPGWVDYDCAFYGHGDLDEHGVKVAPDAEGPTSDPDAPCEPPVCTPLAGDYLALRFPALAGARVHHTRTCPYELTPDTHFIAGPHPEHPSVWLLGGGSGHGFKHGPALAERMRDWLTGAEAPDPRFALGPRTVDTNLRTAGARATAMGRRLPEAAS
jgi:glycine/D-amino acid oxidase-like deaminating enzyme